MRTKNVLNETPFFQSACALDQSFIQLSTLSRQLEACDLETEFGMNQARKMLQKFGECGQQVGEEIQILAKNLEQARKTAEEAAKKVSERALAVQKRHEENESMVSRFQVLGEHVRKVTVSIPQMDKAAFAQQIPELISQLEMLFEESCKIKNDAKVANLKNLEKNAGSLGQTLKSLRNQLSSQVLIH